MPRNPQCSSLSVTKCPRRGAAVQGAPRRYASGYAAPGHHHHDEVRSQDEEAGEVWAQPLTGHLTIEPHVYLPGTTTNSTIRPGPPITSQQLRGVVPHSPRPSRRTISESLVGRLVLAEPVSAARRPLPPQTATCRAGRDVINFCVRVTTCQVTPMTLVLSAHTSVPNGAVR